MIQLQTILEAADNSGAKTVKCIKILDGFKRRYAKLGDTIVVSVQALRNKSKITSKVKKREVYRAVIIRTKTKTRKKNGFEKQFTSNSVALISKQKTPVGTRILGPVSKKLIFKVRMKKNITTYFQKIKKYHN